MENTQRNLYGDRTFFGEDAFFLYGDRTFFCEDAFFIAMAIAVIFP